MTASRFLEPNIHFWWILY